jgi:MoaA/NifB/PqqE/SkfB family radical SAM enzyme
MGDVVRDLSKRLAVNSVLFIVNSMIHNSTLRRYALKSIERRMYLDLIKANPDGRPAKVQEEKFWMGRALLYRIHLALSKGHISKEASDALLRVFLGNVFFGGFYSRRKFIEKHGYKPPLFITISPTKLCNLRCVGCYANAGAERATMPFETLDRIVTDAKTSWGMHFFVISGGEPLVYKSNGKTFLDLAQKHDDCYFLMYTNGTLIDMKMAQSLARLGNITPAISVEGFRSETNERRGPGVYEKIMTAMSSLRRVGVPFGVSVTVTKDNVDLCMSDKFIDFYFEEQGASYGWIFHYMPIGRGISLSRMASPEQRVGMIGREWELVRDRKIFMADFWNSGTSSDGCISAARGGGYFHINWNADVTPCVFAPYTQHNMINTYNKGGDLNQVIQSPLFRAIRKWQADYAYERKPSEHGNLLRQCPVRDHYKEFRNIVLSCGARPADDDAREALEDESYLEGMERYDRTMSRLTDDYWRKEYIEPEIRA